MDMHVDRRAFLATIGVGALGAMSPEDRAEELEHYMINKLDDSVTPEPDPAEIEYLQEREQEVRPPRGTGRLFTPRPGGRTFEPLPSNPTLMDFFKLRFAPATHVLQSATHAFETDQPERTIMACLLHDVIQNLIKVDHGYWGSQLFAPYVDERIAWGIKYHQALRFYPDESVGYEYPDMYNRIFGEDYVPEDYIKRDYEFARNHSWYMEARLITVNDTYGFQEGMVVDLENFTDIIGRHFKQPKEGLGYDGSPVAHMFRSIQFPNHPL